VRPAVCVFWLEFLSPHVAALLHALVGQGTQVVVVVLGKVGEDRLRLGWKAAGPDTDLRGVRVMGPESADALLQERSPDIVHVTEGLGGNTVVRPHVAHVRRSNCRWGVMLESIDRRGIMGGLRWLAYNWRFRLAGRRPDFVLAIGADAVTWMRSVSGLGRHVYPFAYFLPGAAEAMQGRAEGADLPRILYAGQLIRRKRVDLLLKAYAKVCRGCASLHVVGDGPERSALLGLAQALGIENEVTFHGRVSLTDVSAFLADSDCLVLPSDHDGWGAVAGEALLCGVPVIVSSAVGACELVQCSGAGGVFRAGSMKQLCGLLEKQVARGRVKDEDRQHLAEWARSCIGGEIGAAYLQHILVAFSHGGDPPVAPWVARCQAKVSR
jgi:glycosyltransferase involved in cell wall biosynthesis